MPGVGAFTMYGAREAMAAGIPHIEEQIKAIEIAVSENAGLAFDLAKTLIESTCKTILAERSVAFESNDDLPGLFKAVTKQIPFLPPDASAEADARRSLLQTLSGLNSAVQGVCELRNSYGFASHGADGPRARLEGVQALLVAQTADAIVGFLYGAHCQEREIPPARLELNHHPQFNEFVDEQHEPARIFEIEYRPSDVLFNVDLEAYRNALAEHLAEKAAVDALAEIAS